MTTSSAPAKPSKIKINRLVREFSFNGMKLPDPNPELTPEQVRAHYGTLYPEMHSAVITDPIIENNKHKYVFTRAVGTKG